MTTVLEQEWERYRADKAAGILRCVDCQNEIGGNEFATLINTEGRFGRPRCFCCDPCMRSGRWEEWKADHWPSWPEKVA